MNVSRLSERKNKRIPHNCWNCSDYNVVNNYCAAFKYNLTLPSGLRRKDPNKPNKCHRWSTDPVRSGKHTTVYQAQLVYFYFRKMDKEEIRFKELRMVLGLSRHGARDAMRRMVRMAYLTYIMVEDSKTPLRRYMLDSSFAIVMDQLSENKPIRIINV